MTENNSPPGYYYVILNFEKFKLYKGNLAIDGE
jgi:hypothetical protein